MEWAVHGVGDGGSEDLKEGVINAIRMTSVAVMVNGQVYPTTAARDPPASGTRMITKIIA